MSGWIVFVGFLLFCAAACRRARQPLVARPHQPRAATWPELAYLSGMENKKPRGGEARLADSWWAILHHRGYLVAQDPFLESFPNPPSAVPYSLVQVSGEVHAFSAL